MLRLAVTTWYRENPLGVCSSYETFQSALAYLVKLLETGWIELEEGRKNTELTVHWCDGVRMARIVVQGKNKEFQRIYLLLANHAALFAYEIWPHAMRFWRALGQPGHSPERLASMAKGHDEIMEYGGKNYELTALANVFNSPSEAYTRKAGQHFVRRFIATAGRQVA
jgi:hypothetical protein